MKQSRLMSGKTRVGEITIEKQKTERNADSLRNLWTDIKHPKIHIIGVSE